MADENRSYEQRDEEQEVSDDCTDTERDDSPDEEQTDRNDVDTSSIDSRLDSIELMMQRVIGTMTRLADAQSVLVETGTLIDTADDDPTDDDGMSSSDVDDVLDLRIDN